LKKMPVIKANNLSEQQPTPGADDSASRIAARFSVAAKGYHQHDRVQRLSAERLLSQFVPAGRLLDIGAGPGTDFAARCSRSCPELKVVALDIAQGMLETLTLNFPAYQAVAGDAQQLPLRDAHFDSLYSNLVLQWCEDFPRAIAEAARVLKPQGEFHLSVVAAGSLPELAALGLRVNAFMEIDTLRQAFDPSRWQLLGCELVDETVYFGDLHTLLYSIKGVGASVTTGKASAQIQTQVLTQTRALTQAQVPLAQRVAQGLAKGVTQGLRGRQDWLKLQQQAERLRTEQGLALTYKIAYIRARRLPVGEELPERESAT
jgi:malonyl-CoA O-methyltransferase